MSTAAATAAAASPVDVLVEFFSTRLLQKRFRPGNRTEASPEIAACEAEFRAACQRAADAVADGKALDALEWLDMCSAFSEKWMEVCHWVSPKKFREHLTATIGAEWAREDEIPEERELPPIDLKWYKTPEGQEAVQPCVCPACKIECNSLAQYRAHSQGRMHKRQSRRWARRNGGKAVEPVLIDGTEEATTPKKALEKKNQKKRLSNTDSTEDASPGPSEAASSPRSLPQTEQTDDFVSPPQSPKASIRRVISHGSSVDAASVHTHSPYDLSTTLMSATVSGSFCSASSEQDVGGLSLTTSSVFTQAVNSITRERLTVLDSILARLTHDASAADANKALSLATSLANSGAAEQVLQSLMDAAVQADEAAAVALVAAAVAEEVAGFPVMLGDAAAQLAAQLSVSTLASELFDDGFFLEAKTRSRHGGLVRFASALVGHDALPACVLLKCVATALEDATAEDVANAYRAVAAVRLGAEEEAEARAMFRGAVKAKYYPGYVKAMVAPLVA
eukprot:TRINITY_DN80_c0_g2_i4.p1 TRINITY_DN80_c0_g2~~TRINITY_DN80_c0_g2_i4.p1  ORF type:complete len:508 (+),score=212.32 TRINITY_DN80_c0_g2_i4:59-1582(+)